MSIKSKKRCNGESAREMVLDSELTSWFLTVILQLPNKRKNGNMVKEKNRVILKHYNYPLKNTSLTKNTKKC